MRGVREGLQRRVPPEPAPAVPLRRETVLLSRLPAALQEEGPHELPRPLAPGRRGETLRLSSLLQGLLQVQNPPTATEPAHQNRALTAFLSACVSQTRSPQQPRPTGPLHREALQVHRKFPPIRSRTRPEPVALNDALSFADVYVGVRHAGPPPRPHDPPRGEGSLSHLREAAFGGVHQRPHEGPQPIAAPLLPPLQPQ